LHPIAAFCGDKLIVKQLEKGKQIMSGAFPGKHTKEAMTCHTTKRNI
jgi:hypothetical protein